MKNQKNIVVKMALFMLFFTFAVFKSNAADTISVNNSDIHRVIVDTTLNTKGKVVVKYYFIYKNELIGTSKTVIEKYYLCKKYGAEVALVLINNKGRKRITLN